MLSAHPRGQYEKQVNTISGILSLKMMGVLAIITVAIVLAVGAVSSLFNKSTFNDEIENVQALVTQSQSMLKT
ncbi:hypothetical protein [Candidatus Williamhamiltonella defendens]|uniref:hypothetical protein n=1 Tax=Candidatus Williamhamiltonella defendens TaxID=138072 RepID=UPI001F46B38B|nr:hypothetical protein [Candidatus Hamiltonella defensa]